MSMPWPRHRPRALDMPLKTTDSTCLATSSRASSTTGLFHQTARPGKDMRHRKHRPVRWVFLPPRESAPRIPVMTAA